MSRRVTLAGIAPHRVGVVALTICATAAAFLYAIAEDSDRSGRSGRATASGTGGFEAVASLHRQGYPPQNSRNRP